MNDGVVVSKVAPRRGGGSGFLPFAEAVGYIFGDEIRRNGWMVFDAVGNCGGYQKLTKEIIISIPLGWNFAAKHVMGFF